MRIDSAPVTRQTGVTLSGGQMDARVKTGDIIECEVLAKENGVLKLKTGDGGVIKAKLEDGVILSEGDNVKLAVVGKKDGIVYLSTDLDKARLAEPGSEAVMPKTAETGDARILTRLNQLNIPVREELVGRVRDLMAANPNMTVDEAVFLASNKIPADSPMLGSMLSLLSDGAKLDKMITSLLTLLQNPEGAVADSPEQAGNPVLVTEGGAQQTAQTPQIPLAGGAGLTDLINAVLGADASAVTAKAEASAVVISANADAAVVTDEEAAIGQRVLTPENGGAETAKIDSGTIIPQNGTQLHEKITENAGKTSIKLLSELLSGLPEFKGTPPEALTRFGEALVRAAADGTEAAAKWPDDLSRLNELIDKMFAKPAHEGGGERLKQVRDELFLRLTMLEEEISKTQLPGKAAAAAEAQKLVEHVRALQNVEQYVYMQIPVKLSEENKAAELYVFRQRKGSKRIDPDNVNILLSVDLTHLGHWESLVNIRGRDVSLRMEVKSAEAKEFFGSSTVKLHNLLDEAGFRLTEASISYSEEETNPLTALSSLLRFKTGNNPRIDLAV